MTMTYNYYRTLIGEYINLGRDADRLLAEIGFPPELDLDANGLAQSTRIIAAAADNDIDRLHTASGMSMADFARKFGLPYRTIQDWCAARRTPPEYLSILIGYVLVTELRHD